MGGACFLWSAVADVQASEWEKLRDRGENSSGMCAGGNAAGAKEKLEYGDYSLITRF